jgi:hypothetical protein
MTTQTFYHLTWTQIVCVLIHYHHVVVSHACHIVARCALCATFKKTI